MTWAKILEGVLGIWNKILRRQERQDNEEAGANKVKVAQSDIRNESRREADKTWDGPDRSRIKRK